MNTILSKWGNSQGIRISKEILEELGFKLGDELKLSTQNKVLKIEKSVKNIKDLFLDYEENYELESIDWGESIGKEVW
ncbi:AbrB/MazE/SpoVT family DNA-binding domain-containing protein [Parvimonas parva]|uniref:AbrB/MazE/SpoVT family DNA-binding domain-containing protein n=1 Tax=Parvimonas parva TaxID=2769485 RepID=A0ABS1CAS0_9FIRM|nr:AbrB/MazE/SpoVT family DNA-binding domain-containing protein [Parvimonas parva]MBK1469211.1 AbrB/MazE/SpoVT family DNA-binding domain-containing protein [Parvimonas parva]